MGGLGERPRRKYYRITPRGRAHLAEERRQWQTVDATLRGLWRASLRVPPATRRRPRSCQREPERCRPGPDRSARGADRPLAGYLLRRQAIHSVDVAELEDHLREQVAVLVDAGLTPDEAFLVAVKRMGNIDALSREFAREHSDRLWKQLVMVPSDAGEPRTRARTDTLVAFGLAVAAAVAVKLPALFGSAWMTTAASTPAT